MDYISRYGFEFNPYTKSQKSFLIETSQYREVISRLNYLDQVKGFGLITGQPGMGNNGNSKLGQISQSGCVQGCIHLSFNSYSDGVLQNDRRRARV